jgi:hypothetical protein
MVEKTMRPRPKILLLHALLILLCLVPGCATEQTETPEARKRAAVQEIQDWWTGFWKAVLFAGTMYGAGKVGATPYSSEQQ